MCDQALPMSPALDPNHGSFEFVGENPNNRRPMHTDCELRSGKVYNICSCGRRNGLQDSCPRSVCHDKSNQMQEPGLPTSFSQCEGMQMQGFDSGHMGQSQKMGFGAPMMGNGYQEYVGDNCSYGSEYMLYGSPKWNGRRQ